MSRGTLQTTSSSHRRRRQDPTPATAAQQTFSEAMMEETLASAEEIISKWDPDTSEAAYLFGPPEAAGEDDEPRRFLLSVSKLHRSMVSCSSPSATSVSSADARSAFLLRGHLLLEAAMRRLERELHFLLSQLHVESLAPEKPSRSSPSSSENDELVLEDRRNMNAEVEGASSVAVAHLRAVAGAMISAGYGRECVRVFKMMRKHVVEVAVYRLGFEPMAFSKMRKLDWGSLDKKIRSWLAATPSAFKTVFSAERLLCDGVFPSSDAIRESCFAAITADAAEQLLAFPELVVRKSKHSPEKLFRILDLYDTVADICPKIETMFSFKSTAAVQAQATASLFKLAEAARATLEVFESAVQKEASKALAPGGGVHPMTRYTMNYLALLAEYERVLVDIFSGTPFEFPNTLPESLFDSLPAPASTSPSSPASDILAPGAASSISGRFSWFVLVLLCKLDAKAALYSEAALSYLFLANNVRYIVCKVSETHLRHLLDDDWVAKHEAKARGYEASYSRLAWGKVSAAIPTDTATYMTAEVARERMSEFNGEMEAACAGQAEWVVTDSKKREEMRASVAEMLVPAYRVFYERCRAVLRSAGAGATAPVRFAPEDVRNRIYGLFDGSTGSTRSTRSTWLGLFAQTD